MHGLDLGHSKSDRREKDEAMNEMMNNAVLRLRAAIETDNLELYKAGQNRGWDWVVRLAEPIELKRIERLKNELCRTDRWQSVFLNEESSWTPGEMLHYFIMGGKAEYDEPDPSESLSFWRLVFVSREYQCNGHYMRGFLHGAAEFWDAIKNEI